CAAAAAAAAAAVAELFFPAGVGRRSAAGCPGQLSPECGGATELTAAGRVWAAAADLAGGAAGRAALGVAQLLGARKMDLCGAVF
ncbi:MAG: hypothetical protein ACI8PG_003303, partial [Planctomycetota bacterium]